MKQTVKSRRHAIARTKGATKPDCERIRTAFVLGGFRTASD